MIELKGTKKEQAVRQWFNDNHNGAVPTNAKVIDLFHKFKLDHPDISYGCLNGTMKKIVEEGHSQVTQEFNNSVAQEPVEPEIIAIEDMEFPSSPYIELARRSTIYSQTTKKVEVCTVARLIL